jgi:hypothetical protein
MRSAVDKVLEGRRGIETGLAIDGSGDANGWVRGHDAIAGGTAPLAYQGWDG